MIHRVFSDLGSFKELRFKRGLNVLLADKGPGEGDRRTRNGAGKTSFVELIHFLTGSDCDADSVFRTDSLIQNVFGMDLDLGQSKVSVQRSGSNFGKLTVSGDTSAWPITPAKERSTGNQLVSNKQWKTILGELMFGLTGEASEEKTGAFGPKFRSLFAYFVRRQASEAFQSPLKQAGMQQLGDQQVAISYLLGLDWSLPQEWQRVRERERELKELRKAASKGTLGPVIGTSAELRTQLARAEQQSKQMRERVNSFRVLPDYHQQEREASSLTRKLSDLANGNTMDHQLIEELELSLRSEVPPPVTNLERIYEEVGVSLPDAAVRRFEEVRKFHESIIANRRSYLTQEIEAAKRRLAERHQEQTKLDERRAEVMAILQSHGALEQHSLLQDQLSKLEMQTESIRQLFATAETLEGQKTELEIERSRLLSRLQQDYHEQGAVLRSAILAFEEVSSALYEESGSLTISPEPNGPEFEVKIHAQKSKGISNMQIFCFDIMLAQILAQRGLGPGFLVHDSHLFDGVDGRQIGRALKIGADTSEKFGFQYIVTMNSDQVPHEELPDGFMLDDAILETRLTNVTDAGRLFGIRFG